MKITDSAAVSDPLAPFRAKRELWTPANMISFLRMLMVIPAIVALEQGSNKLAAMIFAAAFATDLLDGFIARKTGDVSEYGKIIDPLADKIFVGAVVIAMVLLKMLPVWYVAAILFRDLLILVVGTWASKRFGAVLPSNYYGKAAVLTIALTLFLTVLAAGESVILFFRTLSLALMVLSLYFYGTRVLRLVRETTPAS